MLNVHPTVEDDLPYVTAWEADPQTAGRLGETGEEWHAAVLADADQEHLFATADGEPVGFAVLAGLDEGHTMEVRRVVVRPDQRGVGRGRSLLRAVVARAYRRHGAQRVWLDVQFDNHVARRLYESEGFVAAVTPGAGPTGEYRRLAELVIMVHRPAEDAPT